MVWPPLHPISRTECSFDALTVDMGDKKKDWGPGCSWACKHGHLASDVSNPVVDFAYYLQYRSNTKARAASIFQNVLLNAMNTQFK